MKTHAIRLGIVAAVAGTALWGGSGIASAGGGCHSAPTASQGDTVVVQDLCFVATVLYVKPGTDVTWTNRDAVTHDVVGVGDTWGDPSISLLPGDDVSYRFEQDGVYPYACWLHPGMVGAIVVGDGKGAEAAGVVLGAGGGAGHTSSTAGTPIVADDGFSLAIIVSGAALLLGGLGGGFAIAARSRGKGAVAG